MYILRLLCRKLLVRRSRVLGSDITGDLREGTWTGDIHSATFKIGTKNYQTLLRNWESLKPIPRKTSIPRKRSKSHSSSPADHYKKSVAIPHLDSLIIKMQDRFSDEDRYVRQLLYIVPSIILNNTLELSEETEGINVALGERPWGTLL